MTSQLGCNENLRQWDQVKPEQTGYSRQPAMHKLPLIADAVFFMCHRHSKLNAVSIHWFPIFRPKISPFLFVTKIAMNVILWFLKKEKLNFCFSGVTRKFAPCFLERTVIGKMCFPNNHVEICFLNWRPVFYVCLNKTGFIEHSELNMVILIYQLLIFVIFHHWKQISPNGSMNCHRW